MPVSGYNPSASKFGQLKLLQSNTSYNFGLDLTVLIYISSFQLKLLICGFLILGLGRRVTTNPTGLCVELFCKRNNDSQLMAVLANSQVMKYTYTH